MRKNNTPTHTVELEQINNQPTSQELNEFSAGRFMRGLHQLDVLQKEEQEEEVSPTPTLGHSKVDGVTFSVTLFTNVLSNKYQSRHCLLCQELVTRAGPDRSHTHGAN